MRSGAKIALVAAVLLGGIAPSRAQPVSGASNGIGHQGSLTGNAGSHSSTMKGPAAAAAIPTSPASSNRSGKAATVESDPAQGGSGKH
jgi:hypothetical protein